MIGLGVNVASALLLGHGHEHSHDDGHGHGHGHDHHHHETDNNLRSAYLHVVADALTSVLAIAALLGGRYLGWVWLDPLMGIVGSIVIAVWAWSLIRDTGAVLLDATDAALEAEIRERVEGPGDARRSPTFMSGASGRARIRRSSARSARRAKPSAHGSNRSTRSNI